MSENEESKGWFDRKENVRKLVMALVGVCAVFLAIDVFFWVTKFDKHPYFKWENWPGFHAVYGFMACVVLVFVSRFILRPVVMRNEDYYDKEDTKQN